MSGGSNMKIDINKIRFVPKSRSNDFEICVFGTLPEPDVQRWIIAHNFRTYPSGEYTNIVIPSDNKLTDIFLEAKQFQWLDGFSPNLNKKLHVGHFSNLVLGKAFESLGLCNKIISIYGDTIGGEITKEDAMSLLEQYRNHFQFFDNESFMASEIKYDGDLLKDGTGDYEGTKIFEIGEDKVVGIKSNGQTSYFYQDVALATILNDSTLYLTGKEQCNHFKLLKKLFPNIQHIGLGLVKVSGKKMASRIGNVIFIEDFINEIKETFNNDMKLIYNVFAGFILKSNPDVDKGINLDIIGNPKNSEGLYLSYTMARLTSAGCEINYDDHYVFNSKYLEYTYLKSKYNLKPNILFEALVEHCKEINSLYISHTIKDNPENKIMFDKKLSDLILGCEKLGLFTIKKV